MCFESVELNFTCFVLHYYWMSKQKGKCCVKILKRLGYKLILKYVLTTNFLELCLFLLFIYFQPSLYIAVLCRLLTQS
jgi:hypothetical protein